MQIYLLITEKCNLHCSMCIRGEKTNSELSISDISGLQFISELKEHDVVITGGEPTICKDFMPIVSFLKEKVRSLSICTNGINNFYVDKNFLSPNIHVQISLDGTKIAHNAIRGKNSYSKVRETITKFESQNIPYTISTVVSKKNINCIKNMADELKGLSYLISWNISYEMPFGNANFEEMISTKEWNMFVDDILDYAETKISIQKLFPFKLFDKYKHELDTTLKDKICSNCGSGKNKIYIYPDLSVYPCTCLTDFKLGNLKDNSLNGILNSPITNSFAKYTIKQNSSCNSCKYLKYCNGGCIGMSYHYFQELGMGDIRCPKVHNNSIS